MKQGSADDPFAEDESDPEPPADPLSSSASAEETTAAEPQSSNPEPPTSTETTSDEHSLPWLYSRENARDGREKTKQLHLQQSTAQRESAFKSAVESEVGQSVQLTDLREAALLVAMDHVDEVAEQLREWGYDFE